MCQNSPCPTLLLQFSKHSCMFIFQYQLLNKPTQSKKKFKKTTICWHFNLIIDQFGEKWHVYKILVKGHSLSLSLSFLPISSIYFLFWLLQYGIFPSSMGFKWLLFILWLHLDEQGWFWFLIVQLYTLSFDQLHWLGLSKC